MSAFMMLGLASAQPSYPMTLATCGPLVLQTRYFEPEVEFPARDEAAISLISLVMNAARQPDIILRDGAGRTTLASSSARIVAPFVIPPDQMIFIAMDKSGAVSTTYNTGKGADGRLYLHATTTTFVQAPNLTAKVTVRIARCDAAVK